MANSFAANPLNGVSAFAIDSSNGALTDLGHHFLPAADDLCVSPASDFLYVVDSTISRIRTFSIDPANGSLAPIANPDLAAGNQPFAVVMHPGGGFLYVASRVDATVRAFTLNPVTGEPSPLQDFPLQVGAVPTGLAMHPSGNFLYLHSDNPERFDLLAIGADGRLSLVFGGAQAAEVGPLFVDPTGNFLFLSYYQQPNLFCNGLDQTTGRPTVATTTVNFPAGNAFAHIAFHPALSNCFYGAYGNDAIQRFDFNRTTGAMSVAETITSPGANTTLVAVDPLGEYLYAADFSSSRVFRYALDTSDGHPTFLGSVDNHRPKAFALAMP